MVRVLLSFVENLGNRGSTMRSRSRRQHGFTFIEMLITLAILGIGLLVVIPSLLNILARAKLTSTVQQVSALMQVARLEAVKRSGTTACVEVRYADREVVAYADLDGASGLGATDRVLGKVSIAKGVELHGPGAIDTPNLAAAWNFDSSATGDAVATFRSDGSIAKIGAFRFRDLRGNILEVRVDPQATARVRTQKFALADANQSDDPNNTSLWIPQSEGWTWN